MRAFALATLLLTLAACGGDGGSGTTAPTRRPITTYITSVRALRGTTTIAAQPRDSAPPSPAGGVSVTSSRPGALLPGGSALVRVESARRFTRVIVAVDGTSGYYELTLPEDTVAQVLITLAQAPPTTGFRFRYAIGSGAGATASVSSYANDDATLTNVGTGAVQANVIWDTPTDVDLSLVEPNGRVVYYGAPTSPTGARLDLDSNAGCRLDNRNAENITFGTGITPPSGQYVLRVNHFSACGRTTPTSYIVTLTVRGGTQTFRGTFTGAGTGGGAAAGTEVTRFTF